MLSTSERDLLSTELQSDPLARGYSGMTAVQVVASLLTKNRSRVRARMDSSEIWQSVVISEFKSLTDIQQRNVMALLGFGSLKPNGKEADLFIDYFGAGSATITALAAARLESISRATEVSIPNVIEADVLAVRGW